MMQELQLQEKEWYSKFKCECFCVNTKCAQRAITVHRPEIVVLEYSRNGWLWRPSSTGQGSSRDKRNSEVSSATATLSGKTMHTVNNTYSLQIVRSYIFFHISK